MPAEFHRRGDVSILKLFKESGYLEHASSIDIQDIQQYLTAHPDLVSDWSAYSEDQRTDRGWYFDQEAKQIGYYSVARGCEHEQTFADVTHALCGIHQTRARLDRRQRVVVTVTSAAARRRRCKIQFAGHQRGESHASRFGQRIRAARCRPSLVRLEARLDG
jgi:hypothetical protein